MVARFYKLKFHAACSLGMAFACMVMFANAAEANDRKLLISSFEDIVVEGNILVNIITDKPPSAIVSGDRSTIDSLYLRQSGNVLTLLQKPDNNSGNNKNSAPLSINITNRAVRNIIVRGNGQVQINDMRQSGNARIRILGNGQVKIQTMAVGTLDVSISGNGVVALLSGTVGDARVSIDGSGSYLAPQLQNRNLVLTQNGGAETKANVLDHADIINDGAGMITITGKGKCSVKRKGTGVISCTRFDKSN